MSGDTLSVKNYNHYVATGGLECLFGQSFAALDRLKDEHGAAIEDGVLMRTAKVVFPLLIAFGAAYFFSPAAAALALKNTALSPLAKRALAGAVIFIGSLLLEHKVAFPMLSGVLRVIGASGDAFFGWFTGTTEKLKETIEELAKETTSASRYYTEKNKFETERNKFERDLATEKAAHQATRAHFLTANENLTEARARALRNEEDAEAFFFLSANTANVRFAEYFEALLKSDNAPAATSLRTAYQSIAVADMNQATASGERLKKAFAELKQDTQAKVLKGLSRKAAHLVGQAKEAAAAAKLEEQAKKDRATAATSSSSSSSTSSSSSSSSSSASATPPTNGSASAGTTATGASPTSSSGVVLPAADGKHASSGLGDGDKKAPADTDTKAGAKKAAGEKPEETAAASLKKDDKAKGKAPGSKDKANSATS